MHMIYNIIVGQTNYQLQYKAKSDATFQAVKSGRDPHWVPDDPKEVLLLKPIWTAPHPLPVPGNQATV